MPNKMFCKTYPKSPEKFFKKNSIYSESITEVSVINLMRDVIWEAPFRRVQLVANEKYASTPFIDLTTLNDIPLIDGDEFGGKNSLNNNDSATFVKYPTPGPRERTFNGCPIFRVNS